MRASERDIFFMTLISHCDCIHCYAGNWVLHPAHNAAAITQIEITWKQCFSRALDVIQEFLCFHCCHFLPSWVSCLDLSPLWEWRRERDNPNTHALPQMLLAATHPPVLQWNLCSSPPFISSLPLLAASSSVVLHIFTNPQNPPCFPSICQRQKSLSLCVATWNRYFSESIYKYENFLMQFGAPLPDGTV